MEFIINLSDEQVKAMETDMLSVQEWLNNAAHNKARQCIDKVCEDALNDQTDTILTKAEKKLIVAELAKTGRIISTVKRMPTAIKNEIVAKARVKSAAEKLAEQEAAEG